MHCSRLKYRVALDNHVDSDHVAWKGIGDTLAAYVHEARIWQPDGTGFGTGMALQYTEYSHERFFKSTMSVLFTSTS